MSLRIRVKPGIGQRSGSATLRVKTASGQNIVGVAAQVARGCPKRCSFEMKGCFNHCSNMNGCKPQSLMKYAEFFERWCFTILASTISIVVDRVWQLSCCFLLAEVVSFHRLYVCISPLAKWTGDPHSRAQSCQLVIIPVVPHKAVAEVSE